MAVRVTSKPVQLFVFIFKSSDKSPNLLCFETSQIKTNKFDEFSRCTRCNLTRISIQDFQKTHFKESWSFWLTRLRCHIFSVGNDGWQTEQKSRLKCFFVHLMSTMYFQGGIKWGYLRLAHHNKFHNEVRSHYHFDIIYSSSFRFQMRGSDLIW